MAIIPSTLSKIPGIVTPEQKKQKKLLIIFGIVVLITIVFLYYNYFSSSSSAPSAMPANAPAGTSIFAEGPVGAPALITSGNLNVLPGQQEEIPSLENVQLDFSVFDNPRFTALKEFSPDLDISAIEKGRRNPFLKY